MKKNVKIAIMAAAIIIVIIGLFYVLMPFITAKATEERLVKTLSDAGISEEMWNAKRSYYIPLLNHLIVEDFTVGESNDEFIKVKKITLAIKTNQNNIFAGSVNAEGISFSAGDTVLTSGKFSVVDFSVNTEQLKNMGATGIKKIGKVSVTNVEFKQDTVSFSLEKLNADIGYSEGIMPPSSVISLKGFITDLRPLMYFASLRPQYKIANLELKNSLSNGIDTVSLVIECSELFNIKINLDVSYPYTSFTSDIIDEIKLNSLSFTYTDKSFLNHIFELIGMPNGGESIQDLLNESIIPFASMGGIDTERFAREAANFIAKPNTLDLKTDIKYPINIEDIMDDPFALKLSLSINGGKPFKVGE
jgi:hypothetical protein